ncbi:MAG: hypothetical protein ACO3A4_11575 [Silvanigrellaceae bacterium]
MGLEDFNGNHVRVGAGLMFVRGLTLAIGRGLTEHWGFEGSLDWVPEVKEICIFSHNGGCYDDYWKRLRIGALAKFSIRDSSAPVFRRMFGVDSFLSGAVVYEIFSGRNEFYVGPESKFYNPNRLPILYSKFEQLQIQMGFGKDWSKGDYFFGCEWFGISVPVFDFSQKFTSEVDPAENDVLQAQNYRKNFADFPSLRLFNFYLGYFF